MRSESFAPISLPVGFWSEAATVEALARRDVGQLFRLVQRAGKLTQTRVGMAVGLSQAQISEIMAGSRKVSSVEVLSRIVSGLNIPEPARSVLFLVDTAQSAGTPTAPAIPADDDTGSDDVVAVYATRGLISRTRWNETISGCCEHLWLYGMAELGYARDDDVPGILRRAADCGCDIRVLLLDPDFDGVMGIDMDEGSPPGTLRTRILAALARYQQMVRLCGPAMKVRLFEAWPTCSIIRSDDRMLVTPYLRFFVGSNSPSLELRRTSRKVFDRYARHFHDAWDRAKDWMP